MCGDLIGTQTSGGPICDLEIRAALKEELARRLRADDHSLILDEVGLGHGSVRVDLLVLNGALHGYEVKSDRDSLRRLPRQAATYNQVLDFVTLVTGKRHLEKATAIVPDWWGILRVDRARGRSAEFKTVRQARGNPTPDKLSIAKLLWRAEALGILEMMDRACGVRWRPRAMVYRRLAEALDLEELRTRVRAQLRCRTGWRPDGRLV